MKKKLAIFKVSDLRVQEVEWDEQPSYAIFCGAYAFFKVIDGRAVWTNRKDMAWHNPSKKVAENALQELLKLEKDDPYESL